jgi:hypothetical protein
MKQHHKTDDDRILPRHYSPLHYAPVAILRLKQVKWTNIVSKIKIEFNTPQDKLHISRACFLLRV